MSKGLNLNFINESIFSPTSSSLIGIFLFLMGAGAGIFTLQTYQSMQIRYIELESKLIAREGQRQQNGLSVQTKTIDISSEKMQAIGSTARVLTLPWADLFLGLEGADMQDIALLSFDPNSKKQQVTLSGEAKNLMSVLTYIQKLEAQPIFNKVYLQKHDVNQADASKPVTFTLLAQWQTDVSMLNSVNGQNNE